MTWGNNLKLTIFGESHGPAIGAVLEGLPAGEAVDMRRRFGAACAPRAGKGQLLHAAQGKRRAAGGERPAEREDDRSAAVRRD